MVSIELQFMDYDGARLHLAKAISPALVLDSIMSSASASVMLSNFFSVCLLTLLPPFHTMLAAIDLTTFHHADFKSR
jgi:hypothetical protein